MSWERLVKTDVTGLPCRQKGGDGLDSKDAVHLKCSVSPHLFVPSGKTTGIL